MCSDITVRELAGMAFDEDVTCQIWTLQYETVFIGSFEEAKHSDYADMKIGSFQIEDGVLVMNIY